LIGSLAPDLDADGGAIARPGKILRNFLPRGIANMIDNIFELLTKIINRVFGHRGPLHWPIIGNYFICTWNLLIERLADVVWLGLSLAYPG